jgi:hypothetical protein
VLGRGLVREAERGIERCALDVRELGRTFANRPQQLMQARERQMGLGLDTGRAEHSHAARMCRSHGLSDQTRLADTGLAMEHERLSVHGDVVEQRRQEVLFLKAT